MQGTPVTNANPPARGWSHIRAVPFRACPKRYRPGSRRNGEPSPRVPYAQAKVADRLTAVRYRLELGIKGLRRRAARVTTCPAGARRETPPLESAPMAP